MATTVNNIFRQGDTTDIMMESNFTLDGKKLKVGLYSVSGKPIFETTTGDGLIQIVDSTHFTLKLEYDVTRNFVGIMTLRVAVYTSDKGFVNAGENWMTLQWEKEPVTKVLN
jgi:hypothetical protein